MEAAIFFALYFSYLADQTLAHSGHSGLGTYNLRNLHTGGFLERIAFSARRHTQPHHVRTIFTDAVSCAEMTEAVGRYGYRHEARIPGFSSSAPAVYQLKCYL